MQIAAFSLCAHMAFLQGTWGEVWREGGCRKGAERERERRRKHWGERHAERVRKRERKE